VPVHRRWGVGVQESDVSAAAGWYADPSGIEGQLRWWNGTDWTDHVTPDPSQLAVTTGAAGAAATEPSQPPPPTGAPISGPDSHPGAGPEGWAATGSERPVWQVDAPMPTSSGSSVKTGLIVAAVVGVVLIGLVAVLVLGVLRGGQVSFEVGADGSFDEDFFGDGETIVGDPMRAGDTIDGEVPPDGAYEVTVVVEPGGTYAFDVRGGDELDATVEVYGPSGELLDENDDRGDTSTDGVGGAMLDPYLELDLSPGEHLVVVRGWAGESGPFTLAVTPR
jgi:hypothetical protein